ncbi:helix-turn-helix transcriptional regulator [Streptomyces sp. Rer75]|uniref:helix-turn-helix domain-containing protein n=1 Tax=Streptomyces sp. Rer75 TaxID=2750011 RepID=UPI00211DD45F|nr:helix-turn-helix transcriptional regulator [Streptomyces sp. Rer75]
MSGATGATGTAAEAFAELLRGLKERSGLSYGALAKRLHMSTSTLHRYCNGSAVPPDYAPAERLARVCRATPEELVELHRRWILADAARGRKAAGPEEPAPAAPDDSPPGELPGPAGLPGPAEPAEPAEPGGSDEPVVGDTAPPAPVRPGRRRTALIASVATAALLGALVIAANLPSSGDDGEDRWAGDVTAPTTAPATTVRANEKAPSASASPSPSRSRGAKTGEPSAPARESAAHGGGGARGGADAAERARTGGVPINVATRPYVYEDPCSQHFLVDAEPEQVGPPAAEQDAPRWAAAYGAVSSGEQRIALTVQGTGKDTVVLEELHIRVVAKGAPLAWNDYSMGVGCGGGVGTKSFDADLDDGSPTVTVKNGQRDFPYKVSESDPEIFYLTARTRAHDVRWDLALTWSSGDRHGTVHIDNNGTPFRTSANAGRPGYDYPLGGREWIERPE